MTPTPEQAETQYAKHHVKVYPRLFHTTFPRRNWISKVNHYLMLILMAISFLISTKINNFYISKSSKVAFDLFRDADVLVTAGGGSFGGAKYRSFTANLFAIYLARKLGKKVMIFGPSVEPFTSNLVKIVTRFVLNQVDVITVREQLTFDLLKSIGIKAPLYLTGDPAFLIQNEPLDVGLNLLREAGVSMDPNRFLVGMTTRNWDFPLEKDSASKRKKYLDAIQQTAERILEERQDALIVIFNTSVNISYGGDDRIIANLIKSGIKENLLSRVHILENDYTPYQLKAMIGNMDIFIATRLHSAIFALSMCVPTMILATERHKHLGMMEMMNLTVYLIDASLATSDSLFATASRLIEHRKLVALQIRERLPLIKKQFLKNSNHLNDLVNQL